MMQSMDIGVIGLAVMGRSLALNMADHGFLVGGYNRSSEVTDQVAAEHPHKNLHLFYSLEQLVTSLKRPRKVFLMIKAGAAVDAVIGQLLPLLDEGDIIMDGGNSFYEDTNRRQKELTEKGFIYFGIGVSGGEEGARKGPAIMPGGDKGAYEEIRPILEAIAAKAPDGKPCCVHIGPKGAGHYVKMVHNGIEYADMQLIAESYLLLKYAAGFTNEELADVFDQWNKRELKSFLIGITAGIFREKDDLSDGDLLDLILDSAGQKGTGRYASIESLKQGVNISMITAACNARVMSNRLDSRSKAATLIAGSASTQNIDKQAYADMVRDALYTGKIAAYAQGFELMSDASVKYGWNLNLGEIASIFRAGCIIQAAFLNDITRAFEAEPDLENLLFDRFFLSKIQYGQSALRKAAISAIENGIPAPAFTDAVSYLDAFRAPDCGARLIQAQRDCFGAHTFERTDREGVFHHEWRFVNEQ